MNHWLDTRPNYGKDIWATFERMEQSGIVPTLANVADAVPDAPTRAIKEMLTRRRMRNFAGGALGRVRG